MWGPRTFSVNTFCEHLVSPARLLKLNGWIVLGLEVFPFFFFYFFFIGGNNYGDAKVVKMGE